jgi:hypothetical protein
VSSRVQAVREEERLSFGKGPAPRYETPAVMDPGGGGSDLQGGGERTREEIEQKFEEDTAKDAKWEFLNQRRTTSSPRKWTTNTRQDRREIWQSVPRTPPQKPYPRLDLRPRLDAQVKKPARAKKTRAIDSVYPRLSTREPAPFRMDPLKDTANVERFLEMFKLQADAKRIGMFLVLPGRKLTEQESSEIEWEPPIYLITQARVLAKRFLVHIETTTDPIEVMDILRALAPSENNPAALQLLEEKMKTNFLSSHDYRVDKMWEALMSYSLEWKKQGGVAMTDAALKRLFVQNINEDKVTMSLLTQGSIDEMRELVQMSQGLGLIPKPGSG